MTVRQWDSLKKKKLKLIKLEATQLSSVRNDPKRLSLIVELHEQCAQVDHSLLTPT